VDVVDRAEQDATDWMNSGDSCGLMLADQSKKVCDDWFNNSKEESYEDEWYYGSDDSCKTEDCFNCSDVRTEDCFSYSNDSCYEDDSEDCYDVDNQIDLLNKELFDCDRSRDKKRKCKKKSIKCKPKVRKCK
jgi:hypothetical protein